MCGGSVIGVGWSSAWGCSVGVGGASAWVGPSACGASVYVGSSASACPSICVASSSSWSELSREFGLSLCWASASGGRRRRLVVRVRLVVSVGWPSVSVGVPVG